MLHDMGYIRSSIPVLNTMYIIASVPLLQLFAFSQLYR
jgi:hypothetical protein